MSELNSNPLLDPEIEIALKEQRAGKAAEASQRCKTILEQDPNHDEALHLLGIIAYQQKNYSEALNLFGKAIEIEPKAHYYNNMGNLYNDLGQYKLAQKMYQAGLRLQPEFSNIRMNLGNVLIQLNQVEDAVFQFQAILRESPGHSDALMNLGNLFTNMQRYEQAQEYFKRVIKIQPKAQAFNNLGAIQKHLGSPEKALEYYQEAAKMAPKSPDILFNLAQALLRQKNHVEAIPILEQIIAIDKDHDEALFQLGICHYQEQKQAKAALLFSKVLEINPQNLQCHMFLGNIAFLSGEFSRAQEHYQTYSEAHPTDHKTLYNLAIVYEKLGNLDAASIHINRALLAQA